MHLLTRIAIVCGLIFVPAGALAAPPKPSFTIGDAQANEDTKSLCFPITKHGRMNSLSSTVTFYLISGTAKPVADYTDIRVTVSFGATAGTKNQCVVLTDDLLPEGTETLTAKLIAGTNARLYDGTATGTILDTDTVAPPPPPPPPPVSTAAGDYVLPSPSLNGLTLLVPHDYLTDLQPAWGSGAIPADNGTDPVGAYRQICGTGGLGVFDPALYPGQPGKGHLHEFSGKRNASADTTPSSLIQDGTSTCNDTNLGHAGQNALYWVPALYDSIGNVIRINYNSVYYKRPPRSHPDCLAPELPGGNRCIAFPNGLILFAGQYPTGEVVPPLTSKSEVHWKCSGTGSTVGAEVNLEALYLRSPVCPQLVQVVSFPGCWNGTHLWLPKAAHMSWRVRDRNTGLAVCPSTHPWRIPHVTIQYFRNTDANWGKYCLSSDMKGVHCDLNPTVLKGSTIHGDAILVWDQRARDRMVAGCIDKHLNCSGGDLGDGSQFIGASQPYYIDSATGKRVPRWSIPDRLTPVSEVTGTDQTHAH